MGLESATFIDDLVSTNPVSASDIVRFGANHLRMLKGTIKNSFAGSTGVILLAAADVSVTANLITLTPATPALEYTTRMLVVWHQAVTNTGAVTMNISSLGAKDVVSVANAALISGDLVAGRVYVGMFDGTSIRLIAVTKNYIDQLAFAAALPDHTGKNGQIITTDGSIDFWSPIKTVGGNSLFGTGDIAAGISTLGATVTDNYTILTKTSTIWPIATTAIGKCLTAPAITTSDALGLFAILDNSAGTLPVGWRDSTGALVGKACVATGGVAHVYLENNATAAGTWRMVGTNLEAGLVTIDSTLSSTYLGTFLAPYIALDANTSIHFVALSSGFAALVVDNTSKVLTTPVTVDSTGSSVPNAVFKISATQAICFYSSSATANGAVVLTLSGASPSLALAVGTAATYTTTLGSGWGAEDSVGAPKIAQLTTTLYMLGYSSTTSITAAMAISVSGTTVTIGTPANIITSNCVVGATTTYALTASTALVVYKSGASAPYSNNAVVVSISGTTCTVATPVTPSLTTSASAIVGSSCLLSSTLALVMDDQNGNNGNIYTLTIAATVITVGTLLTFEAGAGTSSQLVYSANSATRHNPHLSPLSTTTALLWYFDTSSISRCVVLSASAGVITKGSILYRSFSQAASGSTNFGMMLAQGTAEFLTAVQVGVSAGWKDMFVPHKISGTTITYGNSAPAAEFSPVSLPSALPTVRLSSGDYVTMGANAGALSVLRTNGDAVNKRGSIALPNLSTPATFPIPAAASNRVVLLSTTQGTTVSGSTQQLRILNVEIAQ